MHVCEREGLEASGRAYPRDCMRFTCIAEHAGEVMRRWDGGGKGRKRMERDNEIERRTGETQREKGLVAGGSERENWNRE